ncbi:hypothetical protein BKA70DRAFT_1235825 [Coprinopsis sp. MPI-PUGE-AT-0042]|nr:hypothetical protein BKA70DRAFT_1235825 [Coprinopsis sp. MPI-PUGE-AT-0042]
MLSTSKMATAARGGPYLKLGQTSKRGALEGDSNRDTRPGSALFAVEGNSEFISLRSWARLQVFHIHPVYRKREVEYGRLCSDIINHLTVDRDCNPISCFAVELKRIVVHPRGPWLQLILSATCFHGSQTRLHNFGLIPQTVQLLVTSGENPRSWSQPQSSLLISQLMSTSRRWLQLRGGPCLQLERTLKQGAPEGNVNCGVTSFLAPNSQLRATANSSAFAVWINCELFRWKWFNAYPMALNLIVYYSRLLAEQHLMQSTLYG